MNLLKGLAKPPIKYLRLRLFERRYHCHVHPEGRVEENNRRIRHGIVVGPNTHIRGHLVTFGHGGRITMGSYCYVGEYSKVWSAIDIKIGDRVLIAHNTSIFDSNTHPLNAAERHRQYVDIITTGHSKEIDLNEEPVVIEDDVWIGCNSVVLKGVTIGRGAVVGAGSVVTKNVPPYVVVAGNPARVVRELSPDER
jgi:acetyltransferase-like isoleucine patch superfamily enzyme